MATLTRIIDNHWVIRPRVVLWIGAMALLAILTSLLTLAIKNNPFPAQDQEILNWISGWELPGLYAFFRTISFMTNNWPGLVLGLAGVAFFWFKGLRSEALAFGAIGAILGMVAIFGDYTLGEWVGRTRPEAATSTHVSFPSGHVFGSTVLFGFWIFMAFHYRLRMRLLVPVVGFLGFLILATGPARIHEQAHWPSDVAAAYLFGAIWLLILIPLFLKLRSLPSLFSPKGTEDLASLMGEGVRIEGSIASVVVLDPNRGTATKLYRPPAVVRFLYWVAFQARFPYENNIAALEAGAHRRKIASLLTIHRFGKDLVAPVTEIGRMNGQATFVTEFVPGEKVGNTPAVKSFLGEVTELFAEAGLSVWQINPRNPHAHTNLIRTPEGDMKIIDLESAVVTPIPTPGQIRSALRNGAFPIFDDIDFDRMRDYVAANQTALLASIGAGGLRELSDAMARGERAMSTWKESELRIVGRTIKWVYRLLNWKAFYRKTAQALEGADQSAQTFLDNGIKRWEEDGRIDPSQAASMRSHLGSGETQDALHHLGVHFVLSVAIVVPIPGLRSLARSAWTLAFWAKAQASRFWPGASQSAAKASNIHSPLVMVLALIPGFGALAYLAARPLRRKLLIRLMFDQAASKLPFKLYRRTGLDKVLAPAPVADRVYEPKPHPTPAVVHPYETSPTLASSGAHVHDQTTAPVLQMDIRASSVDNLGVSLQACILERMSRTRERLKFASLDHYQKE